MQAQVHTNPEKIEAQAQRLKHLITVLACMFLSDCIDSYSCMLTLLEKTRLDCILAACNLNSTKMVTLHAIPFLVVIYSMEFFWVEPDTTHVCLLREGGKNSTCEERCLFTQAKDHGCCFSHMF